MSCSDKHSEAAWVCTVDRIRKPTSYLLDLYAHYIRCFVFLIFSSQNYTQYFYISLHYQIYAINYKVILHHLQPYLKLVDLFRNDEKTDVCNSCLNTVRDMYHLGYHIRKLSRRHCSTLSVNIYCPDNGLILQPDKPRKLFIGKQYVFY